MTEDELDLWEMIKKGLGTTRPIPTEELLDLATELGSDLGVKATRVKEIFNAVRSGIERGTPPL